MVFALFAIVLQKVAAEEPVAIIAQQGEDKGDGTFQFSFESADGTKVQEEGHLEGQGEDAGESLKGSYDFKDNEGKSHHVDWTADKEGYKAVGDDIPQIPEAIARSIEYNAAHPEQSDDKMKTKH